jgi:hypothetical protein
MAMARIRVRFKLWMLMVLVAVAAMAFLGVRLRRDGIAYGKRAQSHRERALYLGARAEWSVRMAAKGYVSTAQVLADRARAEREVQLAEKYRRASRRPWLPVAPDPPGPE